MKILDVLRRAYVKPLLLIAIISGGTAVLVLGWLAVEQWRWCARYSCQPPFDWWHGSLGEETQAAWATALATFLAFFAALLGPSFLILYQLMEAQRLVRRKSRVLSIRALPALRLWNRKLRQARDSWPETLAGAQAQQFLIGSLPNDVLQIPKNVDALVELTAESGALGGGFQDIIVIANGLRLDMEVAFTRGNSSDPVEIGRAIQQLPRLRTRLTNLIDLIREYRGELRFLFYSTDSEGRQLPLDD